MTARESVGVVEPEPLLSRSGQLVYITWPWWSNRGTAADAATILAGGSRCGHVFRHRTISREPPRRAAMSGQHGADASPKAPGLGLLRMSSEPAATWWLRQSWETATARLLRHRRTVQADTPTQRRCLLVPSTGPSLYRVHCGARRRPRQASSRGEFLSRGPVKTKQVPWPACESQ
jgi:hypothetical protein